MTTATETVTIGQPSEEAHTVSIEITTSENISAKIRDIMILKALLQNTLLFLKKVGIQNPGEAADLLHSATIDIWDTVDHEDHD